MGMRVLSSSSLRVVVGSAFAESPASLESRLRDGDGVDNVPIVNARLTVTGQIA
jgi:hypothetical protein